MARIGSELTVPYSLLCADGARRGCAFAVQRVVTLPLVQMQHETKHSQWWTVVVDNQQRDHGALFAPFAPLAQLMSLRNGFRWTAAVERSGLLFPMWSPDQFGVDAALQVRIFDGHGFVEPSVARAEHEGKCFRRVNESTNPRFDSCTSAGLVLAMCRVVQLVLARWSQTEPLRVPLTQLAANCSASDPTHRATAFVLASQLDELLRHELSADRELAVRSEASAVFNAQFAHFIDTGIALCRNTTKKSERC